MAQIAKLFVFSYVFRQGVPGAWLLTQARSRRGPFLGRLDFRLLTLGQIGHASRRRGWFCESVQLIDNTTHNPPSACSQELAAGRFAFLR